jgi:hypothetical protein
MSKSTIITTSWDDGHPLDFRLADLLSKYDLKGTFYIPQNNPEQRILDKKGIKTLSQGFEIGGHTLNHVNLLAVDLARAENEIKGCKLWLEDTLGDQIKAFCYPRGKFNAKHKKIVGESGFYYARTVELLSTNIDDLLSASTTIQLFNQPLVAYVKNNLKRRKPGQIFYFMSKIHIHQLRLTKIAELYLQQAVEKGGVFHVWGHSWEIEQLGLWKQLEEIFKVLYKIPNAKYLTNSQLVDINGEK